jgi:hypothetical protein
MKAKKSQVDNPFVGTWHIYEMELWDEDYFNMEIQAYIEIQPDNSGDFQFGLVAGSLDGELESSAGNERFAFSWDGQDEMDPASGSGWMQLVAEGEVEGLIKIHRGDRSTFKARKVS